MSFTESRNIGQKTDWGRLAYRGLVNISAATAGSLLSVFSAISAVSRTTP
jgi:hypothetical protein